MEFSSAVDSHRILIKNRTDIFGEQLIMNEYDELIGSEEDLLPNATDISVDSAPGMVESFGGICYPAHIDREANGIVATLGTFPEQPFFRSAYPILRGKPIVVSSDAHYLWDISGRLNYFELDCGADDAEIRHALFERLRNP